MRLIAPLIIAALLSACATTPRQAPPAPERPNTTGQVPPSRPAPPTASRAGFRAPSILEGPGLEGIIRQNAGVLMQRFGQPRLNVAEGDMRKLQFAGEACVLDIYLYPLALGTEPVATWVATRRASDGATVDRNACIQALTR